MPDAGSRPTPSSAILSGPIDGPGARRTSGLGRNGRLIPVIRRPMTCRDGAIALLVIAMLLATQPQGVFWHFIHDHLSEHSHGAHDGIGIHLGDADASDHDTDHCHLWVIQAAAVVAPGVCQPHAIAGVRISEDTHWPSAAPFPPFSPPRA